MKQAKQVYNQLIEIKQLISKINITWNRIFKRKSLQLKFNLKIKEMDKTFV